MSTAVMARRRAKLYTTGDVAAIVGVNPKTVTRWIDSGQLKGIQLPGEGGERRVHASHLRAFAEEHGMDWVVAAIDADEAGQAGGGDNGDPGAPRGRGRRKGKGR